MNALVKPMEAPQVDAPLPLRVTTFDAPPASNSWTISSEQRWLGINRRPVLKPGTKVFTLGSCFAEEVKNQLGSRGYATLPRYYKDYDNERMSPKRIASNHINHYSSFSIVQEFEKAAGNWVQGEDDYWEKRPDHVWNTGEAIWQDPYRRSVFARTKPEIQALTRCIDNDLRFGIRSADLFLITLGLVEVWRKRDNGLYACRCPGYESGGGEGQIEFHFSTFAENYANACRIVDLIDEMRPGATVMFTVSPVPLSVSYDGQHCLLASTEGKAILRAVAGQVARERKNVLYFPSYEIVTNTPSPYEADGRHVRRDVVRVVTEKFLEAHAF